MESVCIRHTELPGTSKLFADLCYDFQRVARFYRHDPVQLGSLETAAREVQYPDSRRAAMAQALAAQNPAGELLTRFAQPGTVAVVTGQQVGLFGGPAYTIYKALTAARLAQELCSRGTPAVPVFWLATEDHDFDEIRHTYVFNPERHPVRLATEAPAGWQNVQRPAGGYPVPAAPIAELRAALSGLPYADQVVALVEQAYGASDGNAPVTMGSGFRRLIVQILQQTGVLILDPLDPAMRAIGAPFMAQALEAAPQLRAGLLARNAELAAAGYHAQVLVDDKTSLFFLLENGDRKTLRLKDSESAGLASRAADISPNALLRPVWQDYLLPTAAYVGGPGELAYFAQSSVLYDQLLGRMPVAVPRAGFTLLDDRAEKLLRRYELSLPKVMVPQDALRAHMAHRLVPEALTARFAEVSSAVNAQLDALGGELSGFDPTLAAAMSKSRAKVTYQLEKLRLKTEREALRRDARASADAAYLRGLLYPEGHLQERLHSILPFLALYGPDLPGTLYQQIRPGCPDHQLRVL